MIRWLAAFAALSLGACAGSPGPAGTPPPLAASPAGTGAFTPRPAASIAPVPDDWWRLYNDPELDGLVRASLAANADLRVAYANLDGARASVRQAQAARLPQTALESGLTVDGTSSQPSASSVPSTDYDIALGVSWDVDLFGRLRAGALAAKADAEAQQAALDGVKVAVVADTVLAYLEYCGASRALTVAQDVATAQDRTAALVARQRTAGEVSGLEVSQARTLAQSSRAAIPPFEAQRANALYRLITLQGRPPAEAAAMSVQCAGQLKAGIPVGDGTALLLRRPDIREAERKLEAATARVGVARADLYPKVNLGGALGILAGGFSAAATPLVTWAFPNQAPARAKITQAQASERGALASWDVVVLRALREVETTLAAYDAETRRNRDLTAAASTSQDYARRAAARVRLGDAPGLLRVDADRVLASARLAQVQSDIAMSQAEVALFRALGGGWQSDATAPKGAE